MERALDPTTLIDQNAHYHLGRWAEWMRNYQVGLGFDHASAGIDCRTSDTFDEMVERADRNDARIADAVIGSLDMRHQAVIFNVYLASVWRFRGDPTEVFVEAVAQFWEMAQKRGLS